MRPPSSIRSFLKILIFVAAPVGAVGSATNGCRFVDFAQAATRSTNQFQLSRTDPRVAYEPGAEKMARVVEAALPTALETVERRQYEPFGVPVRVHLCASIGSFTKYGASPRAAGFVINHRLFLSPKPENTVERMPSVVTHELSHLHIGRKLGPLSFARLPVWFVEGLAVEVSGGAGAEGVSDEELRRAISEGRTFVPETEGSIFHRKGAGAYGLDEHMFYGQAGMFVGFLRTLDEHRFEAFLRAVQAGDALGSAFTAAYGFSVDIAWRRFVDGAKAAGDHGR